MKGKEVYLRDLAEKDLETVRSWRNSKEVSQYMYTDHLITKEEHISWFRKISGDKTCKYWIAEMDDKPVGFAGIHDINYAFKSCYWTFHLGESAVKGARIGSKIEYKVLSYVFDELALNKLRGEVFAFNDKVIKMHEKFGFRREAYFREHCFKNDKFEDVIGIGILKSEWAQLKDNLYHKIFVDE